VKKLILAICTATVAIVSHASFAADVDGYTTILFPPLDATIYKAGTPNTLNSSAQGTLIPAVAPGESLRVQFVIPPGGTTAGIGGTSNYWNAGGYGNQPVFGFYNCNPGAHSTIQPYLTSVSGGLSLRVDRPDIVPISEPFFSYFIISNPSTDPHTFTFGTFTQSVSISEEGKAHYSNWVNNGRVAPTVDYACGEGGTNLVSSIIGDYSTTSKYTVKLSGLEQGTFNVGDTININLTETDVPFRSESVDLWAAVQTPSGELLFLKEPLVLDLFSAGTMGVEMFSTTPQLFKENVTSSEKNQHVLSFQAQAGSQGQYIFYVLYMEAGRNPMDNFPTQTYWRSQLVSETFTIQ